MKVIDAYPPNIERIIEHFPDATRKGVMFTYGQVIYAPHGVRVTPALKAHESVHAERQKTIGIDNWWERYFIDEKFRFAEELIAHQAEYRWFRINRPGKSAQALHDIATRLSSKLYGHLVSFAEAKRAIEQQTSIRPYVEAV